MSLWINHAVEELALTWENKPQVKVEVTDVDNLSTPPVEYVRTRDTTWTFYSGRFIHRLNDVSLATVDFCGVYK